MKKIIGMSLGIMVVVGILLGGLLTDTSPVSAMTCNSATFTGYVTTNGTDTQARFKYATDYGTVDAGSGTPTAWQTVPANQDQNIEQLVTGLSPSTQYFYRIEATNQYGHAGSAVENFTTPACETTTPAPQCTASLSFWQTDNSSNRSDANGGSITIPYGSHLSESWTFTNADAASAMGSCTGLSTHSINLGPYTYNFPNSLTQDMTCQIWATNSAGQQCSASQTVHVASQVATDVCPNIQGVQTSVPSGMHIDGSGNCVNDYVQPPYDACPNIAGTQSSVPAGMHTDIYGNCVDNYVPPTYTPPDVCPNIAGTQSSVPAGMHIDGSGNCVNNQTDVCPNIEGVQTSVPTNMHIDASGNCVNNTIQTDVCPNIEGIQSSVPSGMHIDGSGNCVNNTIQTDVCPNIQGIQTSVPSGMHIDGYGNCVDNVVIQNDVCPNIAGTQTSIPSGMRIDGYGNCVDIVIIQTCQTYGALNYGQPLPCQFNTFNPFPIAGPTVHITADSTSLPYNGSTTVRWYTTNATSCFASGGSAGWPGAKGIGPASFFTGSLTSGATYTITCYGTNGQSATDFVPISVRGRVVTTTTTRTATARPASSLVVITSSVDRTQAIVPTLDNTRPKPGDEINYTVTYQNIGTGSIRNLVLRLDLPYEVDYLYSTPANPVISGNTLIFNLGTLAANGTGTVNVRVRVRENIPLGTNLNFPATLSYIDPSGAPQSVSANVSAQVYSGDELLQQQMIQQVPPQNVIPLGASIFGAGFLPTNLFGWLLLFVLILILIYLARYLYNGSPMAVARRTTTTTIEH